MKISTAIVKIALSVKSDSPVTFDYPTLEKILREVER